MTRQPDTADRSLASVLPEAYNQAEIVEERASADLVDERVESAELEEETKKEEFAVNPEAVPVEKADALARQMQFVVVNRGDYLCKIIQRTYGSYSDYLLGILLSENPDIDKPDYIVPGQVIELPATNESKLAPFVSFKLFQIS